MGLKEKEVWLKGAEDGRSDTYQMNCLWGSYAQWDEVLDSVAFPRRFCKKISASFDR